MNQSFTERIVKGIRASEIDTIAEVVSMMDYQPGTDFDTYYPTIEDIDYYLGSMGEDGKKVYKKEELAFLIWLCNPVMKLDNEQENVRQYVMDILYENDVDEKYYMGNDDDYDQESLREAFAKYGMQ